jgi:hypothetical protein
MARIEKGDYGANGPWRMRDTDWMVAVLTSSKSTAVAGRRSQLEEKATGVSVGSGQWERHHKVLEEGLRGRLT